MSILDFLRSLAPLLTAMLLAFIVIDSILKPLWFLFNSKRAMLCAIHESGNYATGESIRQQLSENRYRVGLVTHYTLLSRLIAAGLVEVKDKIYFRLTDKGRDVIGLNVSYSDNSTWENR